MATTRTPIPQALRGLSAAEVREAVARRQAREQAQAAATDRRGCAA